MVSEPTLVGPKSMASASANKMCRLKYSCEEVYERMDKGLCIFCDELDIPGHHDLKHKGIQIFIVDDDLACNDIEEVHQIQQAVKNPNPFVEPVKNSDALIEPLDCASVLQVLDSVSDVLMVHKVDSHVNEVEESSQQSTNSNDKIVAHQLFDQMPNACQKDLTVIESSNKEVLSFSHKDARVWEPGGLPTKMDHWDWLEKELKPYGESHMVATFLYSQMQMGKSNPADFKTFDRKRSNKTLSLEDKQDDEHEQNQVIKLISSWKNRIWEPGGVLIEHNRWEEFEKCYKHGRLMRLMQELSSMWWLLSKSRELERFGACSFVDIKMWLDLCSREYKNQMLLLGYHGLEVQVLSCLQEFGEGSKMGTRIVLCWRKLASFLWILHGKKLVYAGQKMQSILVSDFKTWVPHFGYELRLAGTDPVLGLPWSSFENDMNRLWRGPEAVLSFNSEKMGLDWFFQRDLHKSCLDIRRMITLLCSSADYRKLNLWVDTNYCEIQPDQTHVKLQEMSCSLSEKSLVEFVGYKAHGRELLVMVVKQLTLAATKFHLKHKWRSRLLQSFSELKQRIIVSLWKSLGYLRKAHGSKYEGLVCALERKKLRTIEDDIDHLKKLLATMEGLAQKISCGLLCGNGKFHLKHKWKSRLIQALSGLQFGMGNIVLITSPVKVAYSVLGLEVFVENVVLTVVVLVQLTQCSGSNQLNRLKLTRCCEITQARPGYLSGVFRVSYIYVWTEWKQLKWSMKNNGVSSCPRKTEADIFYFMVIYSSNIIFFLLTWSI